MAKFLRQWSLQRDAGEENIFAGPHCLRLSNDGLVYVCDRSANRVQVFTQEGYLQQIITGSLNLSHHLLEEMAATEEMLWYWSFLQIQSRSICMSLIKTACR